MRCASFATLQVQQCRVCATPAEMPGVREAEGAAADSSSADVVPAATACAVRSCAHDAWEPLLREHAFRNVTVELPQARALLRRCRVLGACSPCNALALRHCCW